MAETVDTLERPKSQAEIDEERRIRQDEIDAKFKEFEAEMGPQIDEFVSGVLDSAPKERKTDALVLVQITVAERLRLLGGVSEPKSTRKTDDERLAAIDAAHAADLQDWVRPHFVDRTKDPDPLDKETMERGWRIRLGRRGVIEYGLVKERPVPVYRDKAAEKLLKIVVAKENAGIAFEKQQDDLIADAKAVVAVTEEALADAKTSPKRARKLTATLPRASAHVGVVEANVDKARTARQFRNMKRGDAAIRAATKAPNGPPSTQVNLQAPFIRFA